MEGLVMDDIGKIIEQERAFEGIAVNYRRNGKNRKKTEKNQFFFKSFYWYFP